MRATIEAAGVLLAYEERGSGPAVLLVHDIGSDAHALAPVADALAARARVIVYDRRGYGESGAPEPYGATTVQEQAEDAAALLAGRGVRDAVLCGDGFGALVVLDLLLRRPGLARAALLADAPLYAFAPGATEELSARRAALEQALRDEGPAAAVRAWLGRPPPPDADARTPGRGQRGFFADLAGLASLAVTRRELRAVTTPTTVLTRPQAPPPIVAAADALGALLGGGRRAEGGDLAAATAELLAAAPGSA